MSTVSGCTQRPVAARDLVEAVRADISFEQLIMMSNTGSVIDDGRRLARCPISDDASSSPDDEASEMGRQKPGAGSTRMVTLKPLAS